MLFIILWIILAFTTANYWSKKNEITFGLALIYCLLLTPLIGGIICGFYKQKVVPNKLVKSEPATKNDKLLDSEKAITITELPKDESVKDGDEQFSTKSHFAIVQNEELDVHEKEENLEIKKEISILPQQETINDNRLNQKQSIEREGEKTIIAGARIEKKSVVQKLNSSFSKFTFGKLNFKTVLFFIGILIVILWVLNPSHTRFKEYTPGVNTTKQKYIYKRTFNGIVFSVYERQLAHLVDEQFQYDEPESYIGFLMNFFKYEKKQPQTNVVDEVRLRDSLYKINNSDDVDSTSTPKYYNENILQNNKNEFSLRGYMDSLIINQSQDEDNSHEELSQQPLSKKGRIKIISEEAIKVSSTDEKKPSSMDIIRQKMAEEEFIKKVERMALKNNNTQIQSFISTKNGYEFIIPKGFEEGESKFIQNEVSLNNHSIGLFLKVNVTKALDDKTPEILVKIPNSVLEKSWGEIMSSPKIIKKGISVFNKNKAVYFHIKNMKHSSKENDYCIVYTFFHKGNQIAFCFITKTELYGAIISYVLAIVQSMQLR